jgi:hypothetical protein
VDAFGILGALNIPMRTKLIALMLLVAGLGLTGCQTKTAQVAAPVYSAEDLNPRQLFGGGIGAQLTAATKPAPLPATTLADNFANSVEREYLMWKRFNRS